eukprot:11162685-Lingulodinium_polyedra.AAC.1
MALARRDVASVHAERKRRAILIDSGSDEHVCRIDFGPCRSSTPGDTEASPLYDIQGKPMAVSDTRRVAFKLATEDRSLAKAEAEFKAGNSFGKNVLSMGKLIRQGYELSLSLMDGCIRVLGMHFAGLRPLSLLFRICV